MTVSTDGKHFFSCGKDGIVKQFSLVMYDHQEEEEAEEEETEVDILKTDSAAVQKGKLSSDRRWSKDPVETWTSGRAFTGIDHHWYNDTFATSGAQVQIWDSKRSEAIQNLQWGTDTVDTVKFNPAEVCLLGSVTADRHIVVHDVRMGTSLRKLTMSMRSNCFAWNPMEPLNFTVGSDDHNLYTYDMRRLNRAMTVHKDHVAAVMDVSYSPTGREFVTGSYDRTLRIFPAQGGRSREVYHTRRMQRLFCVGFSADAQYVLSGSDDTNVRVWKAQASKTLGRLLPRERNRQKYLNALKKRYGHVHEIKRIATHRHVPRLIKKLQKRKGESRQKETRKLKNRRKHSKPGTVKGEVERERFVVKETE